MKAFNTQVAYSINKKPKQWKSDHDRSLSNKTFSSNFSSMFVKSQSTTGNLGVYEGKMRCNGHGWHSSVGLTDSQFVISCWHITVCTELSIVLGVWMMSYRNMWKVMTATFFFTATQFKHDSAPPLSAVQLWALSFILKKLTGRMMDSTIWITPDSSKFLLKTLHQSLFSKCFPQ